MGYLYYGNYGLLFEIGRAELGRALGFPYTRMEKLGIIMPVRQMHVDYKRPVYYDDLLTIESQLRERPSVRIVYHHEIFRGSELLTTGHVELVFVNEVTRRPQQGPKDFLGAIDAHWGQTLGIPSAQA